MLQLPLPPSDYQTEFNMGSHAQSVEAMFRGTGGSIKDPRPRAPSFGLYFNKKMYFLFEQVKVEAFA